MHLGPCASGAGGRPCAGIEDKNREIDPDAGNVNENKMNVPFQQGPLLRVALMELFGSEFRQARTATQWVAKSV